MDYYKSYMNVSGLAERIRAAATEGKVVKASGGLGSRGAKAEAVMSSVPSLDEVRAKYMVMIQDMFPDVDEETRKEEIRNYLDEEEPVRPRRNPQRLSSSIAEGSLTERDILAMTIQAEAGGEGVAGMLAAGAVMDNRLRSGNYGSSMRDVILAPGQFSAWNSVTGYAGGEGGIDMTSLQVSEDAYAVADQILSGQYESPVGGATHYYNPSVSDPDWGQRGGGEWQTIGGHVFGYGN